MFYEKYSDSSLGQRMIAVAGCVIGGAVVLLLGFLGAFADYQSLASYGFGVTTIPFYVVVVICGMGILARIPYTLPVAFGAAMIELVVYFTQQMSTTWDVNFLVLLKLLVIVSCTQLMMTVIKTDDKAPKQVKQIDPNIPKGRRVVQRKPRQR